MNPTCPDCGQPTRLVNVKDGDQGYFCDTCQHGWRIGVWPLTSKKGTNLDRTQRRTSHSTGRKVRHPR